MAQTAEIEKLQRIESLMFEDIERATSLLLEAQNNTTILESPSLKSHLYNLLGYQKILKREFALAIKDLEEARTLAIESGNKHQQAESYRREGLILVILSQHSDALLLLNRSLLLHEEIKSDRVLISLENILNIYEALEQFDKLEEYAWMLLEKSLASDDFDNIAAAHYYLGLVFLEKNNLDRAEYHFNQEKAANEEVDNPFLVSNDYGFAKLAAQRGEYEEALTYLESAKAYITEHKFDVALPQLLNEESAIYIAMGNIELAIQLLNRAAYISEDVKSTDDLIITLKKLANVYEQKGDFEAAYQALEKANKVNAKAQLYQERQLLAVNQAKLDLDTKNRQISQLKSEQQLSGQRQKTQLALLFSTCIVIAILVFFTWRLNQQKITLRKISKDLQRATDAKSDFLARMSHEIRTPINAIIGLTKLSLRSSEDQRQATNLKQIEESSQSLLGIINDILDFSKIEAGKLVLESAPFNIDDVINKAIRLNAGKARDKDLEIIQFVSRDVPVELVGDAFRLQQVLNNLLSNAVKFTDEGSISIVVNRPYLDESQDRNNDYITLQFEVKDTGKGLTTEQKHSLFDSFTQEDESITRKYGGTGLGLAICRQLVELMNGEIWVDSLPSQGTTFFFTVQLSESKEASSNLLTEQQVSNMRVLVVDDSDISRQFIAEALLRIGINPDIVTDGHQCIQKIRLAEDERSPYDLVLLDWKMPDIDGIEVASIIRQGSLAVQPNIVLLSSYDIDDLKELGKPLHINNYLEKPLSSSALFDCITQLKGVRQTIHTTQDSNQKLSKFDGRGKRILLVEDNALNQKVAIGYLKETHADIDVASNGQEAIDLLQSERFDVVLMDIQMPVMDGLTATTLIREKLKSKIPIIAMTAHAMVGDVDKSLAVGMNAHIVKPIEPDTLFKVLDEIVNQNKTRSVERKGKVLPKPHTLGTQSLISIDKEQAIRALNHEPQLYDELVVEFLDLEAQAQQLKQALSKQDIDEIKRIVHAYKPPLSYIGAYSLAVYTSELETMLSRESAPLSQDTQCRVHDFLDALAAITEKLKVKK